MTYLSDEHLGTNQNQRKLLSCIYYLLTDDSPCGYMHRNRSDIVHFFHGGSPIKYVVVTSQGQITEHIMGHDVLNGQVPQLLVKSGHWKSSYLLSGDYGLIGEAVAPGFEYEDNEIMTIQNLQQLFPDLFKGLEKGIKNG